MRPLRCLYGKMAGRTPYCSPPGCLRRAAAGFLKAGVLQSVRVHDRPTASLLMHHNAPASNQYQRQRHCRVRHCASPTDGCLPHYVRLVLA